MIQLVQELLACRVDLGEMIVVNGSSSVTVIRHMKHSKVKVGKCAFIHGPYLTSRANASCQQHPLTFIWIENTCQILEKVILKTECSLSVYLSVCLAHALIERLVVVDTGLVIGMSTTSCNSQTLFCQTSSTGMSLDTCWISQDFDLQVNRW